jgi:hypothetical protein
MHLPSASRAKYEMGDGDRDVVVAVDNGVLQRVQVAGKVGGRVRVNTYSD